MQKSVVPPCAIRENRYNTGRDPRGFCIRAGARGKAVDPVKAIINARILSQGRFLEGKALLFGDRIEGLADSPPADAESVDAGGGYVSAGLIDVHCHGFGGVEAGDDIGAEGLLAMSRALPAHGVTAWLPTVSCLPWERYGERLAEVAQAARASASPDFSGARILGAHAEGPFISARKHGAQNPAHMLPPDWERIRPLLGAIRLMTVAPETEGAPELIRRLAAAGITVSIGHTDADYDQAAVGIEAGATHATHLFNAMPPLLHRSPGAAGALLADGRVYCELIADGFHVHPAVLAITARLKGDRLVLITDSIRFAGLPDGAHTLGGQTVTVSGVECRLPDGTIAGSSLTLDRAVRNLRTLAGVPLEAALSAASANAAASIGETERGRLCPGCRADIAVFNPNMEPSQTFVGGRKVWQA
jgi:N-acetylglucosamine-6-phosphate deacetylase